MDSIVSNRFLFGFEGRINRSRYWYAGFAGVISCLTFMSALASAIGGIFGAGLKSIRVDFDILDIFHNPLSLPFSASFGNAGPMSAAALTFQVMGTPIFVVASWILAATTIKRLHDRNKSGWWIVPFLIAPELFHKLSDWLDNPTLALVVSAIGFALSVWAFVEMLCLRGTRGPNRFGPDPLAPVRHQASRWDQNSAVEFVPHSAGPSGELHVKRGA